MSDISQKQTTYLFVDGSHFRQYFNETTQKWFGQEVDFDFSEIKEFFNAEKAFYYDCIDDIKTDNESQADFELRVELQEIKLNKIREVDGCHVHLGSLSGKGKKKRQKEVDVLLAVQMMEHAFRGNMTKAVLLSGDKDFRPLVESLVRLGLFVEVVGDKNHISQELIHSADSHKKLNFNNYYNLTSFEFLQSNRLPLISFESPSVNADRQPSLIKAGTLKNKPIEIHEYITDDGIFYVIEFDDPNYFNSVFICSRNLSELELYFEILNGKIDWVQL